MAKRTMVNNGDTSRRPKVADGEHWFEDAGEVSSFAYVLDELSAFDDGEQGRGDNILYYFEKPWKWTHEHEKWVSLGRPNGETLST